MTTPHKLPVKPRLLAAALEAALGLKTLGAIYETRPRGLPPPQFLRYTLDILGITVRINNRANLEAVPADGPLLIVANHPLGALDGVAIAEAVIKTRPDLQVLANELLRLIPELAELFIGVDVLSGDAAAGNMAGIKKVHRHLKNNGAVLIFPAGTVSVCDLRRRCIRDPQWNRLVGQLIRRYQCTVVPVHVQARNRLYFYLSGLIHPRLRTALLPRQLLQKGEFKVTLTFGRPVAAAELGALDSAQAVTDHLRLSTDALAPPQARPADSQLQPEQPALNRPGAETVRPCDAPPEP